jgi:voltage-gated potassium channel
VAAARSTKHLTKGNAMADEPTAEEVAAAGRSLNHVGYEIFVAALSVLSIVNLVLLYVIQDPSLDSVIFTMNLLLTAVFLIDFLYRMATAPSRSTYFFRQFGWADLLASLPFEQVKILRIFRLVKVGRLLNEYGIKNITRSLVKDRAGSALYTLLLIAILMLEFGSLVMLKLEENVEGANITTASDALWYVIVTMSTVGYGDQFPISNPGRILGTLIILIGVGIFGTLTGYLANVFLGPAKKPQEDGTSDTKIARQLAELKDLAAQQESAIAALEELIDKR